MECAKARDELPLSVAADASAAEQPRDPRPNTSSKARLAAMLGGLALVGAAVGLVGAGLANSASAVSSASVVSGASKAAASFYSADLIGADDGPVTGVRAAVVKGGSIKGKADLDVNNVLTWALDNLEPKSKGSIHIHAGRSCKALGPSLWDTEVTSSNPWTKETWKSNGAGKSEGTLNINDLVGAYSFPANLGHAVVFYSHDQQFLACGVLKPEGAYRKFGVQSVLNNGFEEHQSNTVAGEVILSKANVLSWGVYNLQAKQSGVVSVLAGRDCSNPDATMFTTEWSTDKWGTSRSEAAIDSADHDFSDLVGRAVVIRNAQGAVVACNTLSVFVEKTSAAIGAIQAGLQDIVDMYKSDPTVTAAIARSPRSVDICFQDATDSIHDIRPDFFKIVDFLNKKYEAYLSAKDAKKPTRSQKALIKKYEASRFLAGRTRSRRSRAMARIASHCYNTECLEAREAFLAHENAFENAALQLDERKAEFANAVAARSTTQEQWDTAAEYDTLVTQKQAADTNLEQLVETIMVECPSDSWCTFESNRFPSGSCTQLTACNNERYHVAEQGRKFDETLYKVFGLTSDYKAALKAKAAGKATEEQQALIEEYRTLERDAQVQKKSFKQAKTAFERNSLCTSPKGSVTLSFNNVLSWKLKSLLPNQKGHIVILEEEECYDADESGQAALPDTTPFANVYWDTTEKKGTSDEGSVNLSTLVGALPYKDNYPRAVAIYNADNQMIACGELRETKTL